MDRIVAGMEGTPMVDSKSKSLVAYHEVSPATVAGLTLILSNRALPGVISQDAQLHGWGVACGCIFSYHSLSPAAWLPRHEACASAQPSASLPRVLARIVDTFCSAVLSNSGLAPLPCIASCWPTRRCSQLCSLPKCTPSSCRQAPHCA